MLYMNVRGLKSNMGSLKVIIMNNNQRWWVLYKLCLQPNENIYPNGYTIYRYNRNGEGGGVMVMVRTYSVV